MRSQNLTVNIDSINDNKNKRHGSIMTALLVLCRGPRVNEPIIQ